MRKASRCATRTPCLGLVPAPPSLEVWASRCLLTLKCSEPRVAPATSSVRQRPFPLRWPNTTNRPPSDYLIKNAEEPPSLDVLFLWDVLQTLLIPIWPKDRTTVGGTPIGDAWPLSALRNRASPNSAHDVAGTIQPFHKLTQWLTYSLMVPFQRVLRLQWTNTESLTALAEYRNGGLFVDLGVLSLKKEALDRGLEASGGDLPLFEAGNDVIAEWRAMTLVLIDDLYRRVQSRMGHGVHLTMAQMLEAGTWKSGREIAAQRRPQTKSSPILIKSDGTVF